MVYNVDKRRLGRGCISALVVDELTAIRSQDPELESPPGHVEERVFLGQQGARAIAERLGDGPQRFVVPHPGFDLDVRRH